MAEYQTLIVLTAFAFLYSVFASGLERTPFSGAVIYLFFGALCGPLVLGIIELDVQGDTLRTLAELTLSLVLFTDSANANLAILRRVERIPIRLLTIGLPLMIAAGFVAGWLLFDQLMLFEIALLAVILAPTDAALGQAVVTNELVPAPLRESLNVESGLNDGISVPILLVFLALSTGEASGAETLGLVAWLPLQQIGTGALVGVALALVASTLIRRSERSGWIIGVWAHVPIVALALLCFAISQALDGSGFIACFIGGLTFGARTRRDRVKRDLLEGAQGTGNVLAMLTWFTFGAVVLEQGLDLLSLPVILYAVLSLTLIRLTAVLLSLAGTPLRLDSKLFLGWFGPRGLASIVFIVMVLDKNLPGSETLAAVVAWTVALSVVLHGLSAVPLSRIYAARVKGRKGAL
jgi:NhaP-type Na+/H+ or K+/H+ antiporter